MFAFVFLAQAALEINDNPYEILGVAKDATRAQIKEVYRKLTARFHPDLNRGKDTTKEWIRIADAYEFLLDPKRRELFDEFGMITGSRQEHNPENNPFKEYQDGKYGNRQVKHEIVIWTPQVLAGNFEEHISTRSEHLFLVVSGVGCPKCGDCLFHFEEFQNKAKDAVKCGLVDWDESPELVERLGVKSVPALVYLRRDNEQLVTNVRHGPLVSMLDISEFLVSQWPRSIYLLHEGNFQHFLKLPPQQVRCVEVSAKSRESIAYDRVASLFRGVAHFGVIANASDAWRDKFSLERLPAFLLFRNPQLKPMVTHDVRELGTWMLEWSAPCLFSADQYSIPRHCREFCCLRCGFPELGVAESLNRVNASTGWVTPESNFARKLNLVEGDWIGYFPQLRYIVRINRTTSEADSLSSFVESARDGEAKLEAMPEGLPGVDWQMEPFIYETIRLAFYLWDNYAMYLIVPLSIAIIALVVRVIRRRKRENPGKEKLN